MKNQTYNVLSKIYGLLPECTDCLDEEGRPLPASVIFISNDDIYVAYLAAYLYHWIVKVHGQSSAPYIVCSGYRGPLSRYIFDEPEADVLADCLFSLGVPANKVHHQSINNHPEVLRQFLDIHASDKTAIICSTLRYHLLIRKDMEDNLFFDNINLTYYAPRYAPGSSHREMLEDVIQSYNGKKLGNDTLIADELASLLSQVDSSDFNLKDAAEVQIFDEAKAYLTARFRLLLSTPGIKDKLRNVIRYKIFLWHLKRSRAEIKTAQQIKLGEYKQKLQELGFI